MSTPSSPPGSHPTPRWNPITAVTAIARSPSSERTRALPTTGMGGMSGVPGRSANPGSRPGPRVVAVAVIVRSCLQVD